MLGPILFGCVEQMHGCVEQMHIIVYIYIYHDGGGSVDGYCVESMLVLIVFRMGLGGRGGMFFG